MNTLTPTTELNSTWAADVTPTSWQPSAPLTFDEWEQVGNTLLAIDKSLNWWIGDWLNYGETKWGEMYLQAEVITGWHYDRLARAKWVASKCPFWLRSQKLSWTCHLNVAALPVEEQKEWLDRAVSEGLHSAELKKAIKTASLPPLTPTVTAINGYDPDTDDVPYSASGPGSYATADAAVMEYEQNSDNDLPVLSWLTFERVQAMVEAALEHRWQYVEELAEILQSVFLPVDKTNDYR